MKFFLAVAVLVSVLAAVSAGMFGANNALNKRFPGSRPISVNEYQKLVKQQQQAQRAQAASRPSRPSRPSSNWMFQPRPQVPRSPVSRFPQSSFFPRTQNTRPIHRSNSDEMDFSREDD